MKKIKAFFVMLLGKIKAMLGRLRAWMKRTKISIRFRLQDMWVGVIWETYKLKSSEGKPTERVRKIYLCILPMLPISITTTKALK